MTHAPDAAGWRRSARPVRSGEKSGVGGYRIRNMQRITSSLAILADGPVSPGTRNDTMIVAPSAICAETGRSR